MKGFQATHPSNNEGFRKTEANNNAGFRRTNRPQDTSHPTLLSLVVQDLQSGKSPYAIAQSRRVPLDFVKLSLDWLQDHPQVNGTDIAFVSVAACNQGVPSAAGCYQTRTLNSSPFVEVDCQQSVQEERLT